MAITMKEWEDHFATLGFKRRAELKAALETLKSDPVFHKQFDWTLVFALSSSIDLVDQRKEFEIADAVKAGSAGHAQLRDLLIEQNPLYKTCSHCGHKDIIRAAAIWPNRDKVGDWSVVFGSKADFCTKCDKPW